MTNRRIRLFRLRDLKVAMKFITRDTIPCPYPEVELNFTTICILNRNGIIKMVLKSFHVFIYS